MFLQLPDCLPISEEPKSAEDAEVNHDISPEVSTYKRVNGSLPSGSAKSKETQSPTLYSLQRSAT